MLPREIIVVEGKDDAAAVKKACQAEVIITNGLGITKKTLQQIKVAQERCGVIIFTDPDYPGEKIRQIIDNEVPGCRHAYLYQQEKGKIGVEYASIEEIMKSLAQAHISQEVVATRFNMDDLYCNGLIGYNQAKERRFKLGRLLGLGETNGKQFLNRMNAYNISRQEFERALANLEECE